MALPLSAAARIRIRMGAASFVASLALAAACGFDGAGSAPAVTNQGDAGGNPGDGATTPIPIDPDASLQHGCNSPSLQAGAAWPMLGGCVTHAGRSAFRGPHQVPREVWGATVSSYHPIPSIGADDTLYVPGEDEGIVTFAPDGGGRSALTVGGGNVTNTPAIGKDGTLYAGALGAAVVRRPDGGVIRHAVNGEVDSSAVLDANGNMYIGTFSHLLVSLDPAGAFRWERDTGGEVNSSPAVGPNGDIYVGSSNDRLFAYGADGTKHWEYDTGGEARSSPVIADDGTIYIGTRSNTLHAVKPDGTKKWTFDTGAAFDWQLLPALGADGTIYTPAGSKLVALRPDGTKIWSFDAGATLRTPVVVDADGIIFVGGDSEQLFALKPDGTQLWKIGVGDDPTGFAIGRDGTMFVTCLNKRVHALHE